jgi:hypothetical protein
MKERDLWKLEYVLKRFNQLAAVVDELAVENSASSYPTDQARGSQSKIVNKSYREVINELAEAVTELKAKAEPYMIEDVDFYEEGDVESA